MDVDNGPQTLHAESAAVGVTDTYTLYDITTRLHINLSPDFLGIFGDWISLNLFLSCPDSIFIRVCDHCQIYRETFMVKIY